MPKIFNLATPELLKLGIFAVHFAAKYGMCPEPLPLYQPAFGNGTR